jgi:F0F1-type ATP synthase assembly protein I
MPTNGGDFRGLAMIGTAVAGMVATVLIGAWVDRRYGTEPWGVTIGAVIGIVGGVGHLITISRRSAGGGKPPSAGQDL